MQITTLNKVVSLFLSGGLLFILFIFFHYEFLLSELPPLLKRAQINEGDSNTFNLLLFFVIMSLIPFLGALIDATSNLILRRPFFNNYIRNNIGAAGFLGQKNAFKSMEWYKKKFEGVLRASNHNEYFDDHAIHGETYSCAVAYFFKSSSVGLSEWTVRHYATYILAANYLVILLVTYLYVPIYIYANKGQCCPAFALLLVILPGVIYLIASLATNKLLYSYEIVFREAILYLLVDVGTSE